MLKYTKIEGTSDDIKSIPEIGDILFNDYIVISNHIEMGIINRGYFTLELEKQKKIELSDGDWYTLTSILTKLGL